MSVVVRDIYPPPPEQSNSCLYFTLTSTKDEVKPICERCTKGGYECLGYEREMLFRNLYTNPSLDSTGPSTVQRRSPNRAGGSGSQIIFVPQPPRELDLSAFRWEIYVSRMFDNFIWRSYGAGWLDLAARGKLGNLSLNAVKALSQFSFGQTNRITDIKVRGGTYYGDCLSVLGKELQSSTALAEGGHHLVCPILILIMSAVSSTSLFISSRLKSQTLTGRYSAYKQTATVRFGTSRLFPRS